MEGFIKDQMDWLLRLDIELSKVSSGNVSHAIANIRGEVITRFEYLNGLIKKGGQNDSN